MAKRDNTNRNALTKHNIKMQGQGYKLNINFGNLGDKLDYAQQVLDTQVWQDVQKYMPIDTGNLISQTNALNAVTSKKVYLYPPNSDYGHYQHEGIVYVDPKFNRAGWFNEEKGQWFSRRGVSKVPSDKKLKYSNPRATDHWGETAIENHLPEWVELVKRAVGK